LQSFWQRDSSQAKQDADLKSYLRSSDIFTAKRATATHMTMNKQEIDSMVVDDLDLGHITAQKGKNVR